MSTLTAEEITKYEQDGIIIPRHGLRAQTLAEIRDLTDRFLQEQGIEDADFVPSLIERDARWLEVARLPEILDPVSELIGEDLILWGSALFCKAAKGGRATPWHQDGQYWPIRPLATVTTWIALDDVGVDNGCMRVIPGSHQTRSLFEHTADGSEDIILHQVLEGESWKSADPLDVVLAPGRFSIHDVYLVHGANRNDSGRRRGGLVFRYMPSSSLYDRELAARQEKEMDIGSGLAARQLHLVRGVDRHGSNDVVASPATA